MADPPRVLVIEDEESIGQVVVDVLVDEGYEVRWARNGRVGLDVLQEWAPSLIVLDLMMPVMDGWTFRTEQLRLTGPAAAVPVIVLSGAREARASAEDLGAVEAITKPFELDDVLASVGRQVGRP